ncbi:chemotaxis protein CheA [Patulibacter sp. SYSU D01012]|uniref:chemotaxis protein CheA n=1 Tax=Patulibacter sp. SYSU D01012 TaxID=2817381 RepID=UPI001B314CB0|nr:chemotaxis protein CheA [Patulibacter sp. SYSU D01012]
MDVGDYLPMFLAEAREHLQELNLAIVELERGEGGSETLEGIFRAAHSLKGMSAAMGYDGIAGLTHAMEDVMQPLRGSSGVVHPKLVDALLAGLDAIDGAIERIEAGEDEALDPEPVVALLRAAPTEADGEASAPAADAAPAEAPEATPEATDDVVLEAPPMLPDAVAAAAAGRPVVHVLVRLDEGVTMPAVRAYMVLAACAEHGEVLGSAPAGDAVDGFDGHEVEAWLVGDADSDLARIEQALGRVGDVAGATATVLGADAPAPAPAAAPEPAAAPAPSVADAAPAAPAAPAPAAKAAAKAPAKPAAAKADHPRKAASVRVDADRLDSLMHRMGELVVHRTRVEALAQKVDHPELRAALQDLQRSSHALQTMVMQVRMVPVEAVLVRFPRLVRDLGSKLGKKAELHLVGQDTELDRTLVDALGDPLVHLVRNALDHGLESPEERLAAGKSEVGTVTIAARQTGGQILIEVQDDGRGVDPKKVARIAVERGILDAQAASELSDEAAIELLFAPGFSTAKTATDVSGRGVGMDAVRAAVGELGGDVTVRSVLGQGTTHRLRLPLTLAITAALLVEVADEPFAVPLDRVERIVRLEQDMVASVAGSQVLLMADDSLPLINGPRALKTRPTDEAPYALVLRGRDGSVAISVTGLLGQHELVTRPMPAAAARDTPVAGGAVLADGQIALIVDVDALSSEPPRHDLPQTTVASGSTR